MHTTLIFVRFFSLFLWFSCGIVSGSLVRCERLGVVKVKVRCGGRQRQTRYVEGEACGANEPHVDCSNTFNTSQVFECREDVLRWARSVAHENRFVAVILRSDTNTCSRGRTTFVLIGCERSDEYRCRKKEFIRRDIGTRKCGCPFKLRCKPVVGGEGWMLKLICGVHNHELTKSLVGHPYAGRLTKAEKTLIADMTKSMVKPRNILLTLKEHNANSCTTIKQIYNARSAFRSSIRGSDLEMQDLMKLFERDQYIHWHKIKDEDVVHDIFWCHLDSVKLFNACNLVFLIDSTYKTNWYKLPLLDFVGVTPTGMTFSADFAYVEGERVNNLVWALQRFRDLFLKRDALPGVIVTNRDQALMNAVKDVFLECTNLLCNFHINKNVKAKCKSLIAQKNAWDYVMDCWGSLTDCPSEQQFDECLKKVESAHSSLKRLLQNSIRDLCSVWDAMNNMITLQHTEIKASFETSTHVVGHVFKKTLYRRLLGMVSRYALNQVAAELERVDYVGKNPSSCGCVVRTTLGLPCACELSKYVGGCIPLDSIHIFWRRLSFSDQGLSELEEGIKDVMETISKRFEELDVCGLNFGKLHTLIRIRCVLLQQRLTQKGASKKAMSRNPRSTKHDPSYWEYVDAFESMQNNNSSVRRTASSSEQPNRSTMMPMLDQFQPFMHDFIDKIVDVKADGNCGYRSVADLLDYIKLFGGIERFKELRMPLLVNGLTKVTTDKSQLLANSSLHRIICIGHVYDNHFVGVYLKEHCPLPPVALWSSNCHPQAKSWPNLYISIMQHYKSFVMFKRDYDEIYYWQPFTYAVNQFRFQCMQLKDDADVNTMLMCNHEFSFVGPIELLCSIARTPYGILNLLEATMITTHDALLYYNGRWNMSRQNEFVGYSFIGKNPKNFDIPTGCTMDELKDLIKQVAPRGIPPYGIDETQMVRRLFFRKPSHHEYSEKVIKFEIIELKTNDDMMKYYLPLHVLAPPQRASQMSTVLLAPAREGYLSVGPEGRLRTAGYDHLEEDLMRGLVS
ncbi:PKS-NRPS hybrid synthetase [Glycine soja]